jgi:hypothetical protein
LETYGEAVSSDNKSELDEDASAMGDNNVTGS